MGTEVYDVIKQIQGLRIDVEQEINILLLGTTGIGKSTFINALANYLSYKSLKHAEREQLMVLIPSHVSLPEKKAEFDVGNEDKNEYLEVGASATQDVKSYVFPIGEGKTKLRIIDTPGIGDTKGLDQDKINCENILLYLSQLNKLHAICYLFSTNSSRINVYFEYCFKEIMSRLDKSASDNMIFIFTKSRGTLFGPGDTLRTLKSVITKIGKQPPHVKIPLGENWFCFENDNFNYLAARKQNIEFTGYETMLYNQSWNLSSQACWSLVKYIVGDDRTPPLKPHDIRSTVSINEARRLIGHLSQPLADITDMIQDNIHVIERHQENLKLQDVSIGELKQKMYMPVVNLLVKELSQPVTVCAASQCVELYQVGQKQKIHYTTRCHDPCYLKNVPRDIINTPELIHCWAMGGTDKCHECGCNVSTHMHVYYETETVEETIEDKVVKDNIQSKEQALKETKKLIEDLEVRKKQYEEESKQITKYMAQFAHFLKCNAITPFNDSYEKYILYMIKREEDLGNVANEETIRLLNRHLTEYRESKKSFDDALLTDSSSFSAITPQMILESINKLYQLPHTGKKIRELVTSQRAARSREYDNTCEYVHQSSGNMFSRYVNKFKKKFLGNDTQTRKHKNVTSSGYGQHKVPLPNKFQNNSNANGVRGSHSNTRIATEGKITEHVKTSPNCNSHPVGGAEELSSSHQESKNSEREEINSSEYILPSSSDDSDSSDEAQGTYPAHIKRKNKDYYDETSMHRSNSSSSSSRHSKVRRGKQPLSYDDSLDCPSKALPKNQINLGLSPGDIRQIVVTLLVILIFTALQSFFR